MSPVVSAKFWEYIRDVALDSLFRDCELVSDHFVRIASRDQSQHIDLAWGQVVFRGMVRELGGDLRGYSLFAGIHGTDGLQKFSMHVPLQYVALRTRSECPQNLNVACVRGQNNDPSVRKFIVDVDDCLY